MATTNKKAMHYRGLTSFFAVVAFIVLGTTGLIMYLMPAGRIAEWVNWNFLGLTKSQWSQIHILFSFAFLITIGFHIYFNWKPLMKYMVSKVSKGINLKKELYLSTLVSAFIVVAAITSLPPFNYVFEFSDFLKNSWIVSEEYEPPLGHAELLSIKSFTKKQGIDLEKAMNELEKKQIVVKAEKDSLGKIAKENNTSPMKIYQVIKKLEKAVLLPKSDEFTAEKVEEVLEGKGIGRKNVQYLISEFKLDESKVLKRLEHNKIDYNAKDSFHDFADRYKVSPRDIVKVIMVKGYKI